MNNRFFSAKFLIDGDVHSETLYMESAHAVRAELSSRNVTILSIREAKTPWWKEEFIGASYKNRFLRAISFHVEAGMSASKALSLIIKEEENTSIRRKLELSEEILKRGGSFSEAIDAIGFFSTGVIALLTVGERTGTLPNAIKTATTYIEETKSQNKGLRTSIFWFMTEFLLALSGAISIQYQLIPWIEAQLINSKIEDESIRQGLLDSINTAYFANGSIILLSLATLIAFLLVFLGSRHSHKQIRERCNKILSKMPGMKSVIYDSTMYIQLYLIGEMLKRGTPFSECVRVSSSATKTLEFKNMWNDLLEKINKGFSISHAFEETNYISRAEKLEIQSHQNSEQLSRILLAISNERKLSSMDGKKKAVMIGLVISLSFTFVSLGIAIWVLQLQSTSINLLLQ